MSTLEPIGGNAFNVTSTLRDGRSRNRTILTGRDRFFLFHRVHEGLCPVCSGQWGSSPEYYGQTLKLINSLVTSAEVRIPGALPAVPISLHGVVLIQAAFDSVNCN
jgi:hypothetical protein